MSDTMLVTGGNGGLGRLLFPLLVDAGVTVKVLSRSPQGVPPTASHVAVDLLNPQGDLSLALEGVSTVVHLAGAPKGDDRATAHLLRACKESKYEVRHLVYISVVGADQLPIGYFRAKAASETSIEESGIPFTILRAAQFHTFVDDMLRKMSRLPVVPTPGGLRFQPVAGREVANRLATLALTSPAGRVPDLVGPEILPFADLLRSHLEARGKRRATVPVRIPGDAGRAYRAGANLAGSSGEHGSATWRQFLQGAYRIG